jgi:molybdenum cofactor cytidylyltransferase
MPLIQNQKNKPKLKIAGVILGAGDSKRLGIPKQLLTYKSKTFIETVTETALMAGLDPIVVVLGYESARIAEALERYSSKVKIVNNDEWGNGQSTSLRVAIKPLKNSSATIFFLTDQPQIPVSLVNQITDRFTASKNDVIAPYVGEKRGNPVLFSKETYADLMQIQGDQGGRSLFTKYEVDHVQWSDERILIDVDTEEDYQNLKRAYGLK